MERGQHQEEQGRHGQIDRQRHRPVRQEPPQLLQVPQGLGGSAITAQPRAHGGGESLPVEKAHQPFRADLEQTCAGEVEDAQEQEQAQHECGEHGQGFEAAGRDDAIVDLQRIQRHAQLQDVDDEAYRSGGRRPAGGISPSYVHAAAAHAAAVSERPPPLASRSTRARVRQEPELLVSLSLPTSLRPPTAAPV